MSGTNLTPVCGILPGPMQNALYRLTSSETERLEEIRLRAGQAPSIVLDSREQFLPGAAFSVSSAMLQTIITAASRYSAYAAEQSLRSGYLTIPGGHRLGVCGTAVLSGEEVKTLKEISSVSLRIAREKAGLADQIRLELKKRRRNLLIIGPPGSGKTTLLRDTVRQISDSLGLRVSVADERCEIAAAYQGVPQLNVGRHTDVLSGCPKAQAMEMLLRAMNPQYLAVDEITAAVDIEAMERAAYCGTYLLATAHAETVDELRRRPLYARLLKLRLFSLVVRLNPTDKTYTLERLMEE